MNKMKKLVRYAGIVLCIATLVSVGGCGMNSEKEAVIENDSEITIILNDRQKVILRSMQISTNVDKMTSDQKEHIVTIEEMLEAVENKYNTKLSYSGFIPQDRFVSYDTVYAYPESGDSEWDLFEIKRKDGIITDSYDAILARPEYLEKLDPILDEILVTQGYAYKHYVEIGEVKENGNPEGAAVLLYIKGVEEADVDNIFEKLANSLESFYTNTNLLCYFVEDDVFDGLNSKEMMEGVNDSIFKTTHVKIEK